MAVILVIRIPRYKNFVHQIEVNDFRSLQYYAVQFIFWNFQKTNALKSGVFPIASMEMVIVSAPSNGKHFASEAWLRIFFQSSNWASFCNKRAKESQFYKISVSSDFLRSDLLFRATGGVINRAQKWSKSCFTVLGLI